MRGVAGARNKVVVGRHIYGNLYECNRDVLADEAKLIHIVKEAVRIANSALLSIGAYRFGATGGITIFAVIAESHISIHTWPEYGFATVDVYTCGNHTDPEAAFDYIARELEAKRMEIFHGDRSMYEE